MSTATYTRERLEAAAGGARNLSEALVRLGADPHGSTRRYVLRRMRQLGVEVSHFEKEGVKWTREVLQRAVSDSTNTHDVLRRLGLDAVGGHHAHISRRIKAFGIDTSHFRVPPRGRDAVPREPGAALVEQDARAKRVPGGRLKRAMLAQGIAESCAVCGTGAIWRGRPLPLEVDHLDGNWRDNRLPNLRLLCPNCHSATDRYRGRGTARLRAGAE